MSRQEGRKRDLVTKQDNYCVNGSYQGEKLFTKEELSLNKLKVPKFETHCLESEKFKDFMNWIEPSVRC